MGHAHANNDFKSETNESSWSIVAHQFYKLAIMIFFKFCGAMFFYSIFKWYKKRYSEKFKNKNKSDEDEETDGYETTEELDEGQSFENVESVSDFMSEFNKNGLSPNDGIGKNLRDSEKLIGDEDELWYKKLEETLENIRKRKKEAENKIQEEIQTQKN